MKNAVGKKKRHKRMIDAKKWECEKDNEYTKKRIIAKRTHND